MKRRKLLLLSMLLTGFCLTAFSQVRTPKLIFTEFAATDNRQADYYELTNMGDTTLDLRDFSTSHMGWWMNYTTGIPVSSYHLAFSDVLDEANAYLEPGKSFVISSTWEGEYDDGRPIGREVLIAKSDLLIYLSEATNDDLAEGEDSVSLDPEWMRGGREGKLLFYKPSPTDSVLVDAINNYIDPSTNTVFGPDPFAVAGITDAVFTHVLVRKPNVTQGNLTIYDWATTAGNAPQESQWMLVPYDPTNVWNPAVFSSVGNHGIFDIVMSSESLTIDEVAGTISVPWGIRKGTWDVINNTSQGIFDEIEWGEGMAWNYEEHSDTATSACQTGDTLNVYAFGSELIHKAFRIIVEDPTVDEAKALPLRQYDYEYYDSWFHGAPDLSTEPEDRNLYQPYFITEGIPGMDTIGNLPFAVKQDSLLAYIEIAPNANTEFIFVDGVERVNLKDGDILRITAEDNSTEKDYYLSVNDIVKTTNALLTAITWPDVDRDEAELLGWNGDTIPGFSPAIFNYTVTLPFGTVSVPALSIFKDDLNSTVKVERATTLNGSRNDMTTTITVTSQDVSEEDKEVNVYKITFEVERPEEYIQPYKATPIISEVLYRHNGQNTMVEIANVGNQPINLQNYMILMNLNNLTPAQAIANIAGADSATWLKRYTKYIPGMKHKSWDEWQVSPAVMISDGNVNPILNPGETFVLGRHHTDPNQYMNEFDEVDIHWSATLENANGEVGFDWLQAITWKQQGQALMVFEILNPDVRDGLKPVTDPLDFVLVDLVGNFTFDSWNPAGYVDPYNNNSYKKKPSAWRPNTIPNGGFADNPEDSDWIQRRVFRDGVSFDQLSDDIGNYSHDPITEYLSVVSSTAYLVDDGYEGNLNIVGVSTGSTVKNVFENIIKPDTGQDLSVISLATNLVLDSTDIVSDGDTLVVVSADEINTTKYVLAVSEGGLDDNATLVAKDGSGLTINTNGAEATGTIEGIALNTPIADILTMVEKPSLAVLNIIDGDNNLVPLQYMNTADSTLKPTLLVGKVYFEVVAQNQENVITYELVLDVSASDAWVESYVYGVDQEKQMISLIPEGVSVPIFLANLIPSGNATIEIMTVDEMKRDSGYLALDDFLRVTSEDESTTADYLLWFFDRAEPDRPLSSEAFVTSTVYSVDEGQHKITEIPAYTEVGTFLANLVPAEAASIELVDESDNPKTSGTVVTGDKLVVTAEDGETTVPYTLEVLVSSRDLLIEKISVYPNPANEVLYLSGVTLGSTVEMISLTGQKVKVMKAKTVPMKVTLEGLEEGYYIINVTDSNQVSAQFRFAKQ